MKSKLRNRKTNHRPKSELTFIKLRIFKFKPFNQSLVSMTSALSSQMELLLRRVPLKSGVSGSLLYTSSLIFLCRS